MKQRHLQGGSLANYIIVAIVIAVVLIGGLIGLQRYNAMQSDDNQEIAQEDERSGESSGDGESGSNGNDTERDAMTDEERRQQREDEQAEREQRAEDEANERSDTAGAATANDDRELPETGPADTALQLIAVLALTFAAVSYARSRSHRWTSDSN